MGGIFISYATPDREAAKAIAGALAAYGWPVWWDRLIPAGRTWREVIDKALGEAGCVLVLWSAAAVASDWVQEEAAEGRRRRVLIPVRIGDVEPPLGFRAIQAADLRNWDGAPTAPEFRRLAGDIAALLGPPPAEPALAAPAREPRPIEPTKPESERRQEYRRAERELGDAEVALGPRLLDPRSTAAVVFGAHDWAEAGLGRVPSFRRSAKGIVDYLCGNRGLGLSSEFVLDLFDDPASAGEQLGRIRDTLDGLLRERRDEGRPVADVLVYYVGHGHTDDQGHLSLLVRRSLKNLEAETGIKTPDLARTLRLAAPQQRRLVVLDCCFSEAAAKAFIGMSASLDQSVAATAAKDLGDDQPRRGTLLLCSSPVGEVSMGPPNAARTLFTGAVLDVLREGAEGKPPTLSFADLRDAAYQRMVVGFGANAPRPVLHQVNAAQGDLTRTPAFPNSGHTRREAEEKARREATQRVAEETAWREAAEKARREAEADFQPWRHREHDAEAVRRLRLAAEQGSADAQYSLGVLCEHGQGGLPKDEREAARLYRLAAEQGSADAQYGLGTMYERGRGGLAENPEEAVRLYRKAAQAGHVFARGRLKPFETTGEAPLSPRGPALAPAAAASPQVGVDPPTPSPARHLWRGVGVVALVLLGIAVVRFGFTSRTSPPAVAPTPGITAPPSTTAPAPAPAQNAVAPLRSPEERFRLGEQREREGNDAEAARLYRLAAEQGSADAQYNLGRFYEDGRGGLPKDLEEATRWYQRAAQAGQVFAQDRLRSLDRNRSPPSPVAPAPTPSVVAPSPSAEENVRLGQQREREGDDAEAARFYRLAASQGYAGAQTYLGWFYEHGRGGLPKDEREAARLYRLAADQGYADAQFNLGRFYEQGRGGLPKDEREAARWYQRTARADANRPLPAGAPAPTPGSVTPPPAPTPAPSVVTPPRSPEETFRLGQQREREGDVAEAARLYRFAADQGHALAQYSLGMFYRYGRGGLAKDDAEAARLFRLAADQGHALAQYSLGWFYEQGQGGLPKDLGRAVHWYQRAAQAGETLAQTLAQARLRTLDTSYPQRPAPAPAPSIVTP